LKEIMLEFQSKVTKKGRPARAVPKNSLASPKCVKLPEEEVKEKNDEIWQMKAGSNDSPPVRMFGTGGLKVVR
jgi:hypothetical protein